MITKTKLWSMIALGMKEKKSQDRFVEAVMKKIEELDSKNVKNANE